MIFYEILIHDIMCNESMTMYKLSLSDDKLVQINYFRLIYFFADCNTSWRSASFSSLSATALESNS